MEKGLSKFDKACQVIKESFDGPGDVKHKALNRIREAVNELRANFEVEMLESGEYDYDEIVKLDDAVIAQKLAEYINKTASGSAS